MRLAIVLIFAHFAHAAPPELVKLREDVRKMATSKACVTCHMPGQSGALQRILDIYNLRNTHWSASLDDKRLVKFQERMQDILTDKAEEKLVATFVRQELAFRRSSPQERQLEIEQNRRERTLNELGILRTTE